MANYFFVHIFVVCRVVVVKQEVSMFEGEPLFASLLPCSTGSPLTDAHMSTCGIY